MQSFVIGSSLLLCSEKVSKRHATKVDRDFEIKHHVFLSRYCTGGRPPLRSDQLHLGQGETVSWAGRGDERRNNFTYRVSNFDHHGSLYVSVTDKSLLYLSSKHVVCLLDKQKTI